MFGISSLGWIHTLGSLPAIPAAAYMFGRSGRIVPRSTAGNVYFASMLIGGITIFLIAHQPASYIIAIAELAFLLVGYGVGRLPWPQSPKGYIETISLTVTAFLLMVPTISETLRRVPDGHPFVTDPKSPILLGVMAGLGALLIVGLAAQIIYFRKRMHLIQGSESLPITR